MPDSYTQGIHLAAFVELKQLFWGREESFSHVSKAGKRKEYRDASASKRWPLIQSMNTEAVLSRLDILIHFPSAKDLSSPQSYADHCSYAVTRTDATLYAPVPQWMAPYKFVSTMKGPHAQLTPHKRTVPPGDSSRAHTLQ